MDSILDRAMDRGAAIVRRNADKAVVWIYVGVVIATLFHMLVAVSPFDLVTKAIYILAINAFMVPAFVIVFVGITAEWKERFILSQTADLKEIRSMDWKDFEFFVGSLYEIDGYELERRGGAGPDGGIDHILRKDGRTSIIQCKKWLRDEVGVQEIRELLGVVTANEADEGILVCCGGFTQPAKEFAEGNAIQLVGGAELYRLLESVKDEVPAPEGVLDKLLGWGDRSPGPKCRRCGAKMVPRLNSGDKSLFWGCSNYNNSENKCRETRNLSSEEDELIKMASR